MVGRDEGVVVEDPILERLDEQVRAQEALELAAGIGVTRVMRGAAPALPGGPIADVVRSHGEDPAPYDLEPEAPRALSLERLSALVGRTIPPEITATLGDYRAIVILHGLTPFHPRGQRPHEIWGMGYESKVMGSDEVRTVAYEPGHHAVKFAEARQELALDLSASGELSTGELAVPGMPVTAGVHASASTRQGYVLSLHLEFSALETMAGPVGAGGVRWDLYRQSSRPARHHRLVQTALVPSSLTKLTLTLTTWVRRRGRFFDLFGTRQWSPAPRSYTISIE
jgi:hypothetical protein